MGLITQLRERFLGEVSREEAIKTAIPLLLQFLSTYFRLKIEGLENIPKKGPAIIIANHSGFTALDAVLLAHQIYTLKGRVPRLIAHRLWFINSRLAHLAKSMGLVEATKENTGTHLKRGKLVILFPEGEAGNFKPSSKAYHLREFKRGFVRLALQLKVPVIPVAIVGAEEANINLKEIDILRKLFGIHVPVPLNVIPLPSKWYMRVMPPLKWSVDPEFKLDLEDPRIKILAHRARKNILFEIRKMLEERGHPFL